MAMKQTAVEQLEQEFFGYADLYPYFSEEDKWVITESDFRYLISKAIEIEKEQMKQIIWDITDIDMNKTNKGLVVDNIFEQYYNETFKSK